MKENVKERIPEKWINSGLFRIKFAEWQKKEG